VKLVLHRTLPALILLQKYTEFRQKDLFVNFVSFSELRATVSLILVMNKRRVFSYVGIDF
jgi:hypothetical protein